MRYVDALTERHLGYDHTFMDAEKEKPRPRLCPVAHAGKKRPSVLYRRSFFASMPVLLLHPYIHDHAVGQQLRQPCLYPRHKAVLAHVLPRLASRQVRATCRPDRTWPRISSQWASHPT